VLGFFQNGETDLVNVSTDTAVPQPNNTLQKNTLLQVQHLNKFFPIQKGMLRQVVGQVRAVDDVSFHISQGETLSLVGESGCGKTTTSRCILRAIQPTGGKILFRTKENRVTDVASLSRAELRPLRPQMQMIFQDPFSSLDPRMTLLDIVGEPLLVNGMKSSKERTERVAELLRLVGLRPEFMRRFPHAFSGGQRQRIGIARALALNPRLIVADEPVSALDVSVQAQILNLLMDLQQELGLTYLFVAHNLSVVKHISDRVAVMYIGKIVELAETQELFHFPKHPYTEALLSAVPKPNPRVSRTRIVLEGEVADPSNPPTGCHFHPRCRYAIEICKEKVPILNEIAPGHLVSCHRAKELALAGIGTPPPDTSRLSVGLDALN
jgi:peptide/nickel transport system ATP-binding protein